MSASTTPPREAAATQQDSVDGAMTKTAIVDPKLLLGFSRGVVDSLGISVFTSYCLRSKEVMVPTAKVFAMNLVLVLTIGVFTMLTRGTGLETLVLISWQVPMRLATDVCGFYGWSLYPGMFYAAQADKHRRERKAPRKIQHSGNYIGEKTLRTLMQLCATLLKALVSQVPALMKLILYVLSLVGLTGGPLTTHVLWAVALLELATLPVCFVLDALVYSFFCFECRLEQQGRIDAHGVTHAFKLKELLALFESCWAYYVGYGFIQFFGQRVLEYLGYPVLATAFYGAMMPIHVVTSLEAKPGPSSKVRLPLFTKMIGRITRGGKHFFSWFQKFAGQERASAAIDASESSRR